MSTWKLLLGSCLSLLRYCSAKPEFFSSTFPGTTSVSLLSAVLRQLHPCIVHAIEFTHSLDYTDLPAPFILSKAQQRCVNCTGVSSINPNVCRRTNLVAQNLRRLYCYFGILLLSGPDYAQYFENELWNPVQDLMSHRYVLGWPCNSGNPSEDSRQVFLPEYFILFDNQLRQDSNLADPGSGSSAFSKYSISSRFRRGHLPPVFLLPSSSLADFSSIVVKGWFICHYCSVQEFYGFDCKEEISCAQNLWRTYAVAVDKGKNVVWVTNDAPIDAFVDTFDGGRYCPMTLKLQTSNCYSQEVELTVGIIFAELNHTNAKALNPWEGHPHLPSVQTPSTGIVNNGALVPTGYSSSFQFITSDSVTKVGNNPLGLLTQPFQLAVWPLILFSIAAVLSTMTSPEETITMNAVVSNTLKTSAVLVGQGQPDLEIVITLPALRTTYARIIPLSTWLILAMVISVSCSCMYTINYTFEPQYQTKWTELIEISNFTLYFGVQLEKNSRRRCKNVYFRACDGQELVTNAGFFDRGACALVHLVLVYVHRGNGGGTETYRRWWRKYQEAFWRLVDNTRIACVDDIKRVIAEELIRPSTAFVSPTSHFATDWQHFKAYNRRNMNAKFASSGNVNELLLKVDTAFGSPLGLNGIHLAHVPARVKSLMTSGIYDLWKKWERMRSIFHMERRVKHEHVHFIPLSLQSSDVYLLFYVVLAGLAVAQSRFICEHFFSICAEARAIVVSK